MKSFNQCTLSGNVGTMPVERTVNEKQVCDFSLGVHEGTKDHEKTTWYTVVAWGKLAETVKTYVKTGDPVLVSGRLHIRTYTDKQQIERTVVEVIATDIIFLSPKKEITADKQEEAAGADMAPPEQRVASI
jgi:single-strand DNA-binding protein